MKILTSLTIKLIQIQLFLVKRRYKLIEKNSILKRAYNELISSYEGTIMFMKADNKK